MLEEKSTGTDLATAFIERTSAHAFQSAAVEHPYLQALRDGDFPDVDWAFRDFALQYGLYSRRFTHYVCSVIKNLNCPDHKAILQANLAEEQGDAHDVELPPDVLATVIGQPHSQLYRRFQNALGIDAEAYEPTPACPGHYWSDKFLQLCGQNEHVGVGAIGIGTEFIVSRVFDQILDGLKAHSDLTMAQRVFFDLHSECDDEHAAQMLSITNDLAQDPKAREQIERGITAALDLRASFWDKLMERAHDYRNHQAAAQDAELPAFGH